MLYYNDCQYLSEQLLLLPQAYATSISNLVGGNGLEFIKEAFRLRSSGKHVLENQVNLPLCPCEPER